MVSIKKQNIDIYNEYFINSKNYSKDIENIDRIFNTCDIQQRSNEWFKLRKITASKIGKAVSEKTFAEFVINESDQVKQNICNTYIHLGVELEDLSQYFYSLFFKAKVLQMSIVPHPYIDCVGSTPDGFSIVKDKKNNYVCKLLEIKCPSKRVIKRSGKIFWDVIPYDYIQQCWLQLECCQMDVNDFWQTRILTFKSKEVMQNGQKHQTDKKLDIQPHNPDKVFISYNDEKQKSEGYNSYETLDISQIYKGNFQGCLLKAYLINYDKDFDQEHQTAYFYPDDVNQTLEWYENWTEQYCEQNKDKVLIKNEKKYKIDLTDYKVYWRFEVGHLSFVLKSPGWFNNRKQIVNQAWKYICFLKQNPDIQLMFKQDIEHYTSSVFEKNKQQVQQKFDDFKQTIEQCIQKIMGSKKTNELENVQMESELCNEDEQFNDEDVQNSFGIN